ncbi:MAG: FecR domain-containing protein [Prolixibacteraceae bacterium]
MGIPEHIKEKLDRLYSNYFLGTDEISLLEKWVKQVDADPQMHRWLSSNWEQSGNIEFEMSFEEIRNRIRQYNMRSKTERTKRTVQQVQKIAAFLALPLLAISIWLLVTRQPAPENLALTTAKGERTHVWLPDSSEVWLNVDSRLEYSTAYYVANRELKLEGEAFFKVAKGKKFPFIVNACNVQLKAIGTEFNISAYGNDPQTSAFLKEGMIELTYSPRGKSVQRFKMNVGEEATINVNDESIKLVRAPASNAVRWTKGELHFEDEPMDEVFRKAERWYDIKIEYHPSDFAGESLTVNLQNGEQVDRLFRIIDEAMGIIIKKTGNEYVIIRK